MEIWYLISTAIMKVYELLYCGVTIGYTSVRRHAIVETPCLAWSKSSNLEKTSSFA